MVTLSRARESVSAAVRKKLTDTIIHSVHPGKEGGVDTVKGLSHRITAGLNGLLGDSREKTDEDLVPAGMWKKIMLIVHPDRAKLYSTADKYITHVLGELNKLFGVYV